MPPQYYPLPPENIATGVIGIILFTGIYCTALYLFYNKTKSNEMRLFYMLLILMSLCELPRYYSLAIDQQYNCVPCYAFHIVADFLYFACIAVVAVTFVRILEVGPYVAILYSKRGLQCAVLIVGIMNFCGFVYCLTCPTLHIFFTSVMYAFFSAFDLIQNVIYASFLSFYGIQLIRRFHHLKETAVNAYQRNAFYTVIKKVTLVLSSIAFFSILRLSILIAKLIALNNHNQTIFTPVFSLYGCIWFLLSDFLPKGVNTFLMAFVMQSGDVIIVNQELLTRGKKSILSAAIEMKNFVNITQDRIKTTVISPLFSSKKEKKSSESRKSVTYDEILQDGEDEISEVQSSGRVGTYRIPSQLTEKSTNISNKTVLNPLSAPTNVIEMFGKQKVEPDIERPRGVDADRESNNLLIFDEIVAHNSYDHEENDRYDEDNESEQSYQSGPPPIHFNAHSQLYDAEYGD